MCASAPFVAHALQHPSHPASRGHYSNQAFRDPNGQLLECASRRLNDQFVYGASRTLNSHNDTAPAKCSRHGGKIEASRNACSTLDTSQHAAAKAQAHCTNAAGLAQGRLAQQWKYAVLCPRRGFILQYKARQVHGVPRVRPNPSLNRSANGRPPGPGWWYAVHFHQPGPGVLPLATG